MNSKHTKRALLSSALALVLCFSMLIGTTFAWFTDTASTNVNTIQAGTLDVALEMVEGDGWVNAEGETLNFMKKEPQPSGSLVQSEEILWEPGCTYKLPELRVVNKGNLALKYKVAITGINGDAKLNEAIEWTINMGDNESQVADTTGEWYLLAGNETGHALTIQGHMKESAGNEYQGLSIEGVAITVYATQYTYEYDMNDNLYDDGAAYDDPWDGKTETAPEQDSAEVYHITNAAELVYAMKQSQNKMNGYEGNPYAFGEYILESNINLGGNTITGFGGAADFQGTFDGNGFTISNFVIDATGRDYYGGLFNYLKNGTVKDLTVKNATVSGKKQVGVLAGCIDGNSTVTNCEVYNSVVSGVKKVGAVVGYALQSTVTDNYAENCAVYYSDEEAGAVLGYENTGCTVSGNDDENVAVKNAAVTFVSTAAELAAALPEGGVIVLLNDINMNNQWTTVNVSNKTLTVEGNGHQITKLNKPLINFYGVTGTINNLTVKDSTVAAVNDLGVGIIIDEAQWANVYMNNCHVKNSSVNVGGTNERAGALVGYWIGGGELKNCSVVGSTVYGAESAGGIVGHNQGQAGYEAIAKVTNCTVSNTSVTSGNYAGAVLGRMSVGAFEINGCTYTGDAYGNIWTGGNGTVTINGTVHDRNG